MTRWLLFAAAVALAAPSPAEACSWFQNQPFTIDPERTDTVAPTMTMTGWEIYRSDPDSTCAGVVNLDLLVAATDDAPGVMGYEVTVVSANADFNGLGDAIVSPSLSGGLSYQTGYGPSTTPLLDLQLTIRAVDLAGNRSEPVDLHVLEVAVPDDDDGGCSAGGGGAAGSALLLALAALVPRRPRSRAVRV